MAFHASLSPVENLTRLLKTMGSNYSLSDSTSELLTRTVWKLYTSGGGGGVPAGGTTNQVLAKVSGIDGDVTWVDQTGGGGSGDVTASTAFGTDNRLIRSDGTGKGVQSTGVTCDDSNNVSGVGSITAGSASVGGINLTSGAIALNKNLTADNTCSGITISGTNGGETIAQWETVYFSAADNEWMKADANVAGKFPAQGITTAATSNGASATVLTTGIIRNDAWNWTVGGTIYLSTTAGGLTQTAPSTSGDCVQPVGYALTADIAYLNFTPAYVEVA